MLIADETTTATLQLCREILANTLEKDTSYFFNNVTINEFHQDRYSTFTTDASMKQVENIGDVADNDRQQYDNTTDYDNAIVVGVSNIQQNPKFLKHNYKGKLHPSPRNDKIATCDLCHTLQGKDQCQLSITAKIIIKA